MHPHSIAAGCQQRVAACTCCPAHHHLSGLLAQRGVELEFIWDEGGCIYSTGVRPFTSRPVALVATAEKLYQVCE
jgi:hypothetical protein